jgi:hypothetical protein
MAYHAKDYPMQPTINIDWELQKANTSTKFPLTPDPLTESTISGKSTADSKSPPDTLPDPSVSLYEVDPVTRTLLSHFNSAQQDSLRFQSD